MAEQLFPYQESGAAFLAQRRRAGLFDIPGLGKTGQVIRALDHLGHKRGIIICPAVARENWIGEFKKFATIERKLVKGVSIHDFVAWSRGHFDTLVTSYELAVKWAPHVHDMCEPLDFVHMDEAHYVKNSGTKRARNLLGANGLGGIMAWADYAWWVTGTPVPNDPIDTYTFLRWAGVMPLDQEQFAKRYFYRREKTFGASYSPRSEMLPELQALLANNSVRRTLEQVGIELPPLMVSPYLVDGDTHAVREMLSAHPGLDDKIRKMLAEGKSISLKAGDEEHVATLRRLIGEAKAIPYAATLLGELESGVDKMVTFGLHRDVLLGVRDYLWKHGVKAVLINGDTSERDRMEAMRAFQNDAACRVMLGNIKAAGTALTMTASCRLDMLESDWSPANNYQAIKRVHRIGQTRAVRVRMITLARSFDEDVNRIVAAKTEACASVENIVTEHVTMEDLGL